MGNSNTVGLSASVSVGGVGMGTSADGMPVSLVEGESNSDSLEPGISIDGTLASLIIGPLNTLLTKVLPVDGAVGITIALENGKDSAHMVGISSPRVGGESGIRSVENARMDGDVFVLHEDGSVALPVD